MLGRGRQSPALRVAALEVLASPIRIVHVSAVGTTIRRTRTPMERQRQRVEKDELLAEPPTSRLLVLTALNALFVSNAGAEGTVNLRSYRGCGSAIGILWSATRR